MQVSSLDGGSPFAHPRGNSAPPADRGTPDLLQHRIFHPAAQRGSFDECFSSDQRTTSDPSSRRSSLIPSGRQPGRASSPNALPQIFSNSSSVVATHPHFTWLHANASRRAAASNASPPSLLASLTNVHTADADEQHDWPGSGRFQAFLGALHRPSTAAQAVGATHFTPQIPRLPLHRSHNDRACMPSATA